MVRNWTRKLALASAAGAITFTISAPGLAQHDRNIGVSAANANELVIANWPNFMSPDMIKRFEGETGINVTVHYYRNNGTFASEVDEMNGMKGKVDLHVVQSDLFPLLLNAGVFEEASVGTMPNYKNVDVRWRNAPWDPDAKYTVPWVWGTIGYAYDSAVYKGPATSFRTLFRPPATLKQKVGMFGGPYDIQLALVYLGRPQCSATPADLKAVERVLRAQKPFVKVYEPDPNSTVPREISGETALDAAYSGRAFQARQKRPTMKFVYPKEGVIAWIDVAGVAAGAPHAENAKKFMNFIMNPRNIALQSQYTGYQSGIDGSNQYLSSEYTSAPEFNPPASLKVAVQKECSAEVQTVYENLSNTLK